MSVLHPSSIHPFLIFRPRHHVFLNVFSKRKTALLSNDGVLPTAGIFTECFEENFLPNGVSLPNSAHKLVSFMYQFLVLTQSSVAQSTTEAEYVVAASCCSQLLWITYTMIDFGEEYTHVPLQCDSTSAISVEKNLVLHSKTKHMEVRYHLPRDNVEKGKITLIHVPTHDQFADIFTKPLDQATFTHLRRGGGLMFV
jgi:hypothetical protein